MDELLKIEEVAKRLQVKKSWIYVHADELGVYRLGKYLRFSWARVLEYLNRKSRSLDTSSSKPLRH
jgi:excisionase family DNA binding protein